MGERLREQRNGAELTLGQVAAYEGISKSYLSALETGANEPNVWPLLARLAQRYRTSADYLLGLTDDPAPRPGPGLSAQDRELLECFKGMSDRGRGELLALAAALAGQDQRWQRYDTFSNFVEALGGEAYLESFNDRLEALARQLGSTDAAIAALRRRLLAEELPEEQAEQP